MDQGNAHKSLGTKRKQRGKNQYVNPVFSYKRVLYDDDDAVRCHICPVCGFGFKEAFNLRIHVLRHGKEKQHPCGLCAKSFINRRELSSHERRHREKRTFLERKICANVRKHSCAISERQFIKMPTLWWHMEEHHDIAPPASPTPSDQQIACARCQLSFADKIALLEHHSETHDQEDQITTFEALEEWESECNCEFLLCNMN